jgi:outer membrane protein TolC
MKRFQQRKQQPVAWAIVGSIVWLTSHIAASAQQPVVQPTPRVETLPAPPPVPKLSEEQVVPGAPQLIPQKLMLGEVLNSLDEFYPLLMAVSQERGIAAGDLLAAEGAFDLKLKGATISQPQGFYQNYRNSLGLEQPTWNGGKVSSGYRIGDGDFAPWYGERETNEGGEFAVGAALPFWKDRVIDKRRAEIFKAQIKQQMAEPKIRKTHIIFAQQATHAYWNWIASIQSEIVYRQFLRIAMERDDFISKSIKAGFIAEVEQIDNRRVIASRESSVVAANRKSQKAAIELSLFLRDPATAQPIVVDARMALTEFPEPQKPQLDGLQRDLDIALQMNPELNRIRLEQQKTNVQLNYARNQTLPDLEGSLYASQDVGARASSKGDKSPFELEAGLYLEVPLQRRQAWGMIRTAEAELAQLRGEERYTSDYIAAKLRDSVIALQATYERIGLAKQSAELARKMEKFERQRFELGQSNILFVNIREVTTNDAELSLVGAYADYFMALADYRAALSANTARDLLP